MSPDPRLDTLPSELLDYALEFVPALDAYFLRLVSRALVAPCERRVNRAIAQLVALDDGHGILDFEDGICALSRARTGSKLVLQCRTLAGLLARANLRPGSLAAVQIAAPKEDLSDAYVERTVDIFRALNPSTMNIAAAVDQLALLHANIAPGTLGRRLVPFVKEAVSVPADMLAAIKKLRGVRLLDRWMLEFLAMCELNKVPKTWLAAFFKHVFLAAAQENAEAEQEGNGIVALLQPLFAAANSAYADLVLKHCNLG